MCGSCPAHIEIRRVTITFHPNTPQSQKTLSKFTWLETQASRYATPMSYFYWTENTDSKQERNFFGLRIIPMMKMSSCLHCQSSFFPMLSHHKLNHQQPNKAQLLWLTRNQPNRQMYNENSCMKTKAIPITTSLLLGVTSPANKPDISVFLGTRFVLFNSLTWSLIFENRGTDKFYYSFGNKYSFLQ